MAVGIVYRPPSQTNFLETMNKHFYKLDTINKETYILGDLNINMYLNNKYVLRNARLQFQIFFHTMYGNTRNSVFFLA